MVPDTPQAATSTLSGQDKKKKADNKLTSLTGSNGGLPGPTSPTGAKAGLTSVPNKSENSSKSKTGPSFNELLAKYEKEGIAQRKKGQSSKVEDMEPSSKHQERSGQGNYASFS